MMCEYMREFACNEVDSSLYNSVLHVLRVNLVLSHQYAGLLCISECLRGEVTSICVY